MPGPASARVPTLGKTLGRSGNLPHSLHGDVGAFVFLLGQVRNAVVDQAADALQKLDPRGAEVIACVSRPQLFQKRHRHVAHEAAVSGGLCALAGGLVVAFSHLQLSFISTVRIRFSSLARVGAKPAMEVGRPMCRRSVPISTTNSSPFLNNPTSRSEERRVGKECRSRWS